MKAATRRSQDQCKEGHHQHKGVLINTKGTTATTPRGYRHYATKPGQTPPATAKTGAEAPQIEVAEGVSVRWEAETTSGSRVRGSGRVSRSGKVREPDGDPRRAGLHVGRPDPPRAETSTMSTIAA